MKRIYNSILTAALLMAVVISSIAQNTYVKQVLIGAGGNYNDPDENVTISSYNPDDLSVTFFGDVLTHSIQDIVISGDFVYVAAEDSIAKFNINTFVREAITYASGVNQLYVNDDILFVSFQYPVTENFVKVYSADDLSFIQNITNISDECSGMLVVNNNLFVSVPGGWTSTVGKIAIVNLSDYQLLKEVDLGNEGVGIFDLFFYNNKIMSVNRTPYLGTTGYLSEMTIDGTEFESHFFNQVIGKLAGVKNNMLYTIMNNGIGSINLDDMSINNAEIVSSQVNTMVAIKLDTVNNNFYFTTTDYFSSGEGYVYTIDGEALGTFDAMISAEAIEIDYRNNTGIASNKTEKITVFPNPATSSISFAGDYDNFRIIEINGKVVKSSAISSGSTTINIEGLNPGYYILRLSNKNGVVSSPFIKK